ncbi:MAG: MogA/MoaB family molybdenum cofactor biosynthesis protein [Nitrospirales bacterium]|nr:MogA/MoaB family molybdenum cofactor biosynthesis protein [Nitrospirales bacterium]
MLQVVILVVSSKILAGEPDKGREALEHMVGDLPGKVVAYEVGPDDRTKIREHLVRLCDEHHPDVILTIGGTGVRPTDWAPEATRDMVDKEVPGIGEAMRQASVKKVLTAMLSRGTAGIRKETLIINLPGSAKGARENLAVILPVLDHTVDKIKGVKREL